MTSQQTFERGLECITFKCISENIWNVRFCMLFWFKNCEVFYEGGLILNTRNKILMTSRSLKLKDGFCFSF